MSVSPSRASWMLVAVTLAWMTASEGRAHPLVAGLTLIGLRMPLALVALAAWQPRAVFGVNRAEFAAGFVLGSLFFVAFALQTWGLAFTTPSLSAFFTSVCSAWVPLLCWVAFRERPRWLTLAGLGVGLLGCAVLVEGWTLRFGNWLTLGSSVFFAVEMLYLDRVGRRLDPAKLSAGFIIATGTLGMGGAVTVAAPTIGVGEWANWVGTMLAVPKLAWGLVALATLSTAVAFHWMNSYQPRVPASRAALIYLLEAVFAAGFSVMLGIEPLTGSLVLGGALIIVGNILVEVPGWMRGRTG
jgi:drug/metabolite transporter (DMT)-like permease